MNDIGKEMTHPVLQRGKDKLSSLLLAVADTEKKGSRFFLIHGTTYLNFQRYFLDSLLFCQT